MRQLILSAPGQLRWTEAPAPDLSGPHGALVEPIAVATCDFDHLLVSGRQPAAWPLAIGHEFVARVLRVGDEVRKFAPGDVVIVPFQISCGSCAACARGQTSACARVPWLSCYGLGALAGDWGGAASDVVSVPYADAMLVRLPEGLAPHDAAAISCNVVDAYRTVGPQLAAHPGAEVLVVAGAFANISLYTIAIARGLGAGRVDFCTRDAHLAERAARLGAQILESPEQLESMRYPITVDASMDVALLRAAVRATAPGGVCTVSTMYPGDDTPLPLFAMFERCLTLQTGQPHVRTLIEPVLGLVARDVLQPGVLTDELVTWDDAPRAFAAGRGKYVCTRGA